MFNPLNFFKKKPAEPVAPAESALEPVVEKKIQIDNIAIHAMPERFRHQPAKADSAKTTGLLIIGGGAVFLILASAGLYFYLFRKPTITVKSEPPVVAVTPAGEVKETQPEIKPDLTVPAPETAATSGEQAILPADNNPAAEAATTTPETVEADLSLGLIPGLDSEGDGLTDAEEILLGASTSTPDTDGDGYLDSSELSNLYDPAGPGKLSANPRIASYENKTYNYSALYPGVWLMSVNGGDDSIMFKAADNQFFQIIVQPNSAGQTLDQWYKEQLDAAAIDDASRISGANWQGIKSLDGLTLYLMDAGQKYIFTLAYNPGENNILEYPSFFNLMIKSFVLKE